MVTFPNAKINIGLDIISRRADGYHNIESVMIPVPWRDIIEIVPAKGNISTLTITGRKVNCPTEKNLVMKAYRAMEKEHNLPPVDIFLHKVIPDGAGLGGGSADAAFTITALNEMFKLNLSNESMASIAQTIGADCPFFIYNCPMLASGTGTDLKKIKVDLSGYKILIVKPAVSVPTAQAYAGVTPTPPNNHIEELIHKPINQWQNAIKNDFEHSIFPSHPIIENLKNTIMNMGAVYASMSGSGSAVYGLFKADKLSEEPIPTFEQCDIFVGEL